MHDFVVAGIANAIQMLIGYPLDTAKVWIQSEQKKPITIRNLYGGVQYPMIGQSAMIGVCFYTFDYGMKNGINPVWSGFLSGSLVSTLIVPFETMKITKQYEPLTHVNIRKMYFKCFWPIYMRETVYITTFMSLQHWFRTETDVSPTIYGAICSSASWITTYPLDTYKTNQILFHTIGKTISKRPIFDIGLVYSLCRVSIGGSIFMGVYNWLRVREPTVPRTPPLLDFDRRG
jgi:hypothetical protein